MCLGQDVGYVGRACLIHVGCYVGSMCLGQDVGYVGRACLVQVSSHIERAHLVWVCRHVWRVFLG